MSDAVADNFEKKLARIDIIVKQLESGEPDLEEAVKLFEEGKKLSSEAEALLKGAQEKLDKAMGEGQAQA